MKLIKPIVKVGNSAGVLLPKQWLNGEAEVTLIRKPKNIKYEILQILEEELYSISGLYLVGSYARKEQTSKSDIDVLGITQKVNKKIKKGNYEILLVSRDVLDESLKNNVLPLLPMLKEALPIINQELLYSYNRYPLSKNNLSWHIETTRSALHLIKESIELAKEEDTFLSDNIAYSLILRLRQTYIVNCLIKDERATTAGLLRIIKTVTGSLTIYEAYQRSKSNLKIKREVTLKEAESLYIRIADLLTHQEKWISKKG